MNNFISIMALVGVVTLIFSVLFFGAIAATEIADFVARKKYAYKVKHRFDKPPTAKCYCVDCITCRNGFCHLHNFNIVNDWFCKNAIPREREVKKDGL